VSVSPRLTTLGFCPSGDGLPGIGTEHKLAQGQLFEFFLQRACAKKGDIPYMQNLRTVRFVLDPRFVRDDQFYSHYAVNEGLNLVRRLPAIEELRMRRIKDCRMDHVVRPPRGLADYSSIVIKNSIIYWPCLCDMIRSARTLRRFVYHAGSLFGRDIPIYYPGHVFRPLLIQRNTLEYLDLDVQVYTPDLSALLHYGPYVPLDSDDNHPAAFNYESAEELCELQSSKEQVDDEYFLRSFRSLRHLGLGIRFLYCFACGFGHRYRLELSDQTWSLADYLPPHFESLRIYDYDPDRELEPDSPMFWLHAHIAKLMQEKEAKLPSLRVVEGFDEHIPLCQYDDYSDDSESFGGSNSVEDSDV
jgi:hypothetical protein